MVRHLVMIYYENVLNMQQKIWNMCNKLKNLNKRPNVYIRKIKLHIYKLHQNINGIYFIIRLFIG